MLWCTKFIFIHIPRTGGDSINETWGRFPYISRDVYANKHISARKMKRIHCFDIWKDAYKFTVIRDPFEMIKSWYNLCLMRAKTEERGMETDGWKAYCIEAANTPFALFARKMVNRNRLGGFLPTYINLPGVHVHNLQGAHNKLQEIMGMKLDLLHVNKSTNFINEDTSKVREMVHKHCFKDIEFLKDFKDGRTFTP